MPRRAPAATAQAAAKAVHREPPPHSVRIPGIYRRLTEMAREAVAYGDPDPRCALAGSEDPGRFDRNRPGNVKARTELVALLAGEDVTVGYWRVMDATDNTVMPLFARGVVSFHVGRGDYLWPAGEPVRRPH